MADLTSELEQDELKSGMCTGLDPRFHYLNNNN